MEIYCLSLFLSFFPAKQLVSSFWSHRSTKQLSNPLIEDYQNSFLQ